jgi:type IX secretion system substrate protein/PKD domain-containing protein
VTVKINPLPMPQVGISHNICSGQPVSLGYPGTTGHTYQWRSNPPGFSSTLSMPTDSPTVSAWYILTETNPATGCSNSDSTLVFVNPLPKPSIDGPDLICGSDTPITYTTPFDTGATWQWAVKNGAIASGQGTNSALVKFDLGIDIIMVTETNSFGCMWDTTKYVAVRQMPNSHFKILSDSPAYVFKAIDTSEQYYLWDFGDGTTGNFIKATHQYPFTKDSSIHVTLSVGSPFGCLSVFDTIIDVHYFAPPVFNIKVFPNPFENKTQIQIELDHAAHIQIMVYDAIGRRVINLTDVQQPIGTVSYSLDANRYQLSDGAYFVVIFVDDKRYVLPVVRE